MTTAKLPKLPSNPRALAITLAFFVLLRVLYSPPETINVIVYNVVWTAIIAAITIALIVVIVKNNNKSDPGTGSEITDEDSEIEVSIGVKSTQKIE